MHQNPFSAGPAGGAYDAPPDPSRLGRGYLLPIPLPGRRLRRLELGVYGASVLRPPQHKILATPMAYTAAFWNLIIKN